MLADFDQDEGFLTEDQYRQALAEHKFPGSPPFQSRIHHSTVFFIDTVQQLLDRAEKDRVCDAPALCVIENISVEWAVALGVAWHINPSFFVEYLEEPDFPTRCFSFNEGRVPGSNGGLHSHSGGPNWHTIRGVVEYGKRQGCVKEDLDNDTIRRHGQMDSTVFERHLWHTNLSVYRLHSKLTVVLVDRLASCHKQFALANEPCFPNQTIVRLAFARWPGHVAFPGIIPTPLTAVLPLWTLLLEQHTSDSLLRCLEMHGVDDFLYKAAVFECQRHMNAFRARINTISFPEELRSETEINEELHHMRLALNRLYRCIQENCIHERAFARLRHVSDDSYDHCDRDFFQELEAEIMKLDKSVLRTMEWLSTTMSIKDSSESLRLTQSTMQQTKSMALLTRLAFVYAPLTFTTGIFGMNLREMNESGPRIWIFVAVLSGIMMATLIAATVAPQYSRLRQFYQRKAPLLPMVNKQRSSPQVKSSKDCLRPGATIASGKRLIASIGSTRRSKKAESEASGSV